MATPYQEKLNHRKWQIKRLKIFERDNFTCQLCETEKDAEDSDKQLHCHHKYYLSKTDPWDYPNEAFITYCDQCHINIETLLKAVKTLNWPIVYEKMSDFCHIILLSAQSISVGVDIEFLIKELTNIRNGGLDKNS